MKAELARETLDSMKGGVYDINGSTETIDSYVINPAANRVMISTNKKTREHPLDELQAHLKKYTHKGKKKFNDLSSIGELKAAPVKEKASPAPKLPKHVGSSSDIIHFTTDYSMFKNITGNRELNERKIKRIIKDIEEGLDMIPYCPIIVDHNMQIIDGQHRYFICKKLKKPVYFILAKEEISLHAIARINSNTERWKGGDFIHCYSSQGNENYIRLQKFIDKYKLPITTALRLLNSSKAKGGGHHMESFEKGFFKIENEEKAHSIMKVVVQFKEHPRYRKREFIEAISRLIAAGLCDFDRMLKKFTSNPEALKECSTAKAYLQELELIYNKDNSKRIAIY